MIRSTLRAKKYAEAKQALFDAAMELFREKGFDETSVDEIAERAGFSRATFFNHFGTKSAVLRFFGERLQVRMERLLSEAHPKVPPLERVREMLLVMAKEAEAHREDLRIVFVFSVRDPNYLAGPTPAQERILELVSELVGEAQRRGEARRDLAAHDQAVQILGLYWNALLTIIFGRRRAGAAIDSAWRFALRGIQGGSCVD
jgi:TetR/AcrR family transcriptional regulator, cholesterol catabolism regulator